MGRDRRASYASSHESLPSLANSLSTQTSASSSHPRRLLAVSQAYIELPAFIKPTPIKIPLDDLEYLIKKGALTLPEEPLRSELLRSHFDFVHPYMPLLNRKEFLRSVTSDDGSKGKVSLLLFQAVMFTGSAVCLHLPYGADKDLPNFLVCRYGKSSCCWISNTQSCSESVLHKGQGMCNLSAIT